MSQPTVLHWLHALRSGDASLGDLLQDVYGSDPDLLADRRQALQRLLEAFAESYGDGTVWISRAPGRVNLMGRHVDHRGGFVNPIALSQETLLAARPRDDDLVRLRNVDGESYPEREFILPEKVPEQRTVLDNPHIRPDAWDRWTAERSQARRQAGLEKEWVNYVEAALVYFQDLFREQGHFVGMDVMAYGNVPPSAGLSSSSSLFTAAAEMAMALNGHSLPPGEFGLHGGWGEWYIGTRGGTGDHLAIKLGRRGQISRIGSRPLQVSYVPFPDDYRVLLCNSHEIAHKGGGARDHFNQRIAAYEIGLLLWHRYFHQYADRIPQLRDVNPETLGVPLADIYRMIEALPERMSREEARAALPTERERLEAVFATHSEPKEGYAVRSVCLYGLSECARSRQASSLLSQGRVREFGLWMLYSHHGDRVTRWKWSLTSPQPLPWNTAFPDEMINDLIRRAEAGDPTAELYRQWGAYECSTERIDWMVEVATHLPGVVGAQLSGAGLGGVIMVLVHRDHVEDLQAGMLEQVYRRFNLEPGMIVCQPIQGSGMLDWRG